MYGRPASATSALPLPCARAAKRRAGRTPRPRDRPNRRSASPGRGAAYCRPEPSWHDAGANRGKRETSGMANLTVNGIDLEVLRRGGGPPLLLLHGFDIVHPKARFLDLLGRHAEIVAPSSPGFGNTRRPPDFDTIYD